MTLEKNPETVFCRCKTLILCWWHYIIAAGISQLPDSGSFISGGRHRRCRASPDYCIVMISFAKGKSSLFWSAGVIGKGMPPEAASRDVVDLSDWIGQHSRGKTQSIITWDVIWFAFLMRACMTDDKRNHWAMSFRIMSLSDSGVFRSFIASSTEIDKLSMIARTELIFLLNDLRSVQPSQFFQLLYTWW